MIKSSKRVIALMYVCILAISVLAGCGKTGGTDTVNNNESKKSTAGSGKGRYLEEDYTLPENLNNVFDLKELKDGTVRMITDTGIFDSKDGGKTWDVWEHNPEVFKDQNKMLNDGVLNSEGSVFISCYLYETTDDGMEIENLLIDQDGKQKNLDLKFKELDPSDLIGSESVFSKNDMEENTSDEGLSTDLEMDGEVASHMDMSNMVINPRLTDDEKLFSKDYNGNLIIFNLQTGEIEQSFDTSEDSVMDYCIVGDRLVVKTMKDFQFYDINSGKLVEENEVLNTFYSENAPNESDYVSIGNERIIGDSDSNTLYFVSNKGVFRYVLGGTVVEEVINASLNSLSDPSYYLYVMTMKKDNSYLAAMCDSNNNMMLKNYYFSAEADATPTKELKAYALYDNTLLRMAISKYQRENPDVYINLEIGVPDNSSVEPSDAIRTLNTNIIAGTGPDILLLDHMPINSYIEKGVLLSLNDILDEIDKTDGIFKNISNVYKNDEEVYAVPTRFEIPIVTAPNEYMEGIKDLTTLADTVEKIREKDSEIQQIMGYFTPEDMLSHLYKTFSSSIRKEDGTLEEKSIEQFYKDIKRINDTNKQTNDSSSNLPADIAIVSNGTMGSESMYSFMAQVTEILSKASKLAVIHLPSINDMQFMVNLEEKDYSYKQYSGDNKQSFIPKGIVGISAKTEYLKESKDFIKMMLESELQSTSVSEGFPLNRAAFDQASVNPLDVDSGEEMAFAMSDEEGNFLSFRGLWLEEDQIQGIKEMIESMDTPLLLDTTIENAIVTEGVRALKGEISETEAAAEVMKKLNLYLSE